MVSLDKLRELHKGARIARDGELSAFYGYLIGEVTRNSKEPSDGEVVAILEKYRNSIKGLGGEKAMKELDILEGLLPNKMGEAEIIAVLNEHGFGHIKDVMKHFMANHAGKYDSGFLKDVFMKWLG